MSNKSDTANEMDVYYVAVAVAFFFNIGIVLLLFVIVVVVVGEENSFVFFTSMLFLFRWPIFIFAKSSLFLSSLEFWLLKLNHFGYKEDFAVLQNDKVNSSIFLRIFFFSLN